MLSRRGWRAPGGGKAAHLLPLRLVGVRGPGVDHEPPDRDADLARDLVLEPGELD
jgi:hypothetical protein